MIKGIVTTIFVLLLIGVIFLAANLKNAYKIIPISTSETLKIPSFEDWREFVAQSKKFKVFLPVIPQYAKEIVDIPDTDKKRKYEMYVSEKMNNTLFMISLITYPADIDTSNTNQMLHDVVNEMMKTNPSNHLVSLNDTVYQGHQAIDFHVANQEFDVQGKAFMVDKTLYLLTYLAKGNDFNLAEYEHFIDSFELLPNGSKS